MHLYSSLPFIKKWQNSRQVQGGGQVIELKTRGEGISTPERRLIYSIFHLYSYAYSIQDDVSWKQILVFLWSAKIFFSAVVCCPFIHSYYTGKKSDLWRLKKCIFSAILLVSFSYLHTEYNISILISTMLTLADLQSVWYPAYRRL